MKKSLILLTALFSCLSYADLAEDLQRNCFTQENLNVVGSSGTCRIVVAPKKLNRVGYCVGYYRSMFPCGVTFISNASGAGMNLTCGSDMKNPVLNQDMPAEGLAYNVATLIKTSEGQDFVQNDPVEYAVISNSLVEVTVLNGTGKITLSLQGGKVPLTNVICQ